MGIRFSTFASATPLASTLQAGKVKIATDQQVQNGVNVIAAVTPAQVKSAVEAGIGSLVGGLTYQGKFDPSIGVPDLRGAKQGWFYKVSKTGNYLGIDMTIGDNMYISADMPETTVDTANIDIIDNTESISVLTDLGDVTLNASEERQGLVYLSGEWVNNDLVWALPDLDDVALAPVESGSYSSSTASLTLTIKRDHVVDVQPLSTKVLNLPASTGVNTDVIYVNSIGGGDVKLRVSGATYFNYGGINQDEITVSGARFIKITAQRVNSGGTDYLCWQPQITILSERQSLTTQNDATSWENAFLNVTHILGAARQGEVDRVEAAVGLDADGTFTQHTNKNYINAATTMRNVDIALDAALKSEETARISSDDTLQSNINAANTRITNEVNARVAADSALQAELDTVEAAVGLSADGTITAFTASNYLNGLPTVKSMVSKLDTEMSRVEQLTVSGVNDLQDEVDNTQASLGVSADGDFVAFTASSFVNGATTFREVDSLLDSALKTEQDARVADVTRIDLKDAEQDARLNALEAIDPNHQAELDAIESSVGLEADGSISAWNSAGTTLGTISNIKAGVEALDTEIETIRNLVAGGIDGLQAELDRTQAALGGLTPEGDITSLSGSNYLDNADGFLLRDLALDQALKTEEDARILGDDTLQSNLDTVESTLQANITAETQGRVAYDGFLEGRIATLETTSATLDGLLNATIQGAGLEANGTWVVSPGAYIQNNTNYNLGNIDDMHTAVDALDAEIKGVIYDQYIGVYSNNWIAPSSNHHVFRTDGELQNHVTNEVFSNNTNYFFVRTSYTLSQPEGLVLDGVTNTTLYSYASATGASSVSEFKFPLTITGATSLRNVIKGFQVEGLTTIDGTLGAHRFIDSQLLGGITLTGMQGVVIFKDCDITGDVTIDATFAGAAYFINCDFDGVTSFTNNALAQQVYVTECKLFPIASLAQVTPVATMSLSDQSVRFFGTHVSLPNALSFTGNTSELNNDADFVTSTQATVNAPVQSVNGEQGNVVLDATDIEAVHAATHYSPTTSVISSHLSAIDFAIGLKANSADLADVALSGQAADVIVASTVYSNYSPLLNSVEGHLAAIDEALGTAGAVKTVNTVTPDSLTGDVRIDADDIIVPASFTAGYSISIDRPITEHFSAIDLAISLAGKVEKVNGVEPDPNKEVTIDGTHIAHASSITAWTPAVSGATISSIADAFNGLNTKLSDLKSVAYSGDYADLTNVPTAGINQGLLVTSTAQDLDLLPGRHYIIAIADTDTLVCNLPSATNGYVRADGDYIRITNWGNGTIKLREVDGESHILNGQTILDGSAGVAEIDVKSRGTIHIFGFDFTPVYPQAWGVYYTSSVEFNTKNAQDGAIFKFNTVTQKMELSEPLSAVAYDGTDAALEVGATVSEYTPTAGTISTLLQGHLEGIDARFGELKDATNIIEDVAVNNFTPTSLTVEGYFQGIDTKLAGVAASQGDADKLQVGNGSGGLVDREWVAGADNHLKPALTESYDIGGSGEIVRKVYTKEILLGTEEASLAVSGGVLSIGGNALKSAGAPLYDGVITREIVSGANYNPSLNHIYIISGANSETWQLPQIGESAAGVVVDVVFRSDCEGQITLLPAFGASLLHSGSTLTSLVIKGRGNQARLAFDGTDWAVTETRLTTIRGAGQLYTEINANANLKVSTNHRSVSDTSITCTLPPLSTIDVGDVVLVSRGANLGAVLVNPAGVDVGANAIYTQNGYASSFTLSRKGETVTFISDGTKWVTVEERIERRATVYTSSPVQLTDGNIFAGIDNALDACIVNLPSIDNMLDGDFVDLYAVNSKELTINLHPNDAASAVIVREGVEYTQVFQNLSAGASVRFTWEASTSSFYMSNAVGTAATKDVGDQAGNVVQLDSQARLPAVDGSLLTGIVTGTGRYVFTKVSASTTATNLYHHSVDTTLAGVTLTLPDLSTLSDGDYIRAKLTVKGGSNALSIAPAANNTIELSTDTLIVDVQGDSVELIANTADLNWEIV